MADDSFRVKNTLVVNGAFVANSTAVVASAVNATSVNTATANATTSIVVGGNVAINTSAYAVGNSTVNTNISSTTLRTGNTTVNTVVNSTSVSVVNATTSTIVGLADIRIGSTTTNVVIANTTSSFGGNVSVVGSLTSANVTASVFTGNVTGNVTGTSSNATNLNSQPGSFYTNATNITAGTLPMAQLGAAVVNTSGNFTVAGNINFTAANVIFANVHVGANVDLTSSSLFVGNATVNTVATAGQITLSGATINATNYSGTANNANNLGGVAAAGYAQLTGAAFTGAVSVASNVTITGNLIVTGTTMYANVTNLDVKDLNITVAKGVATAAAADGAGLTVDTANVTWNYNHATISWQSNVNITPASNNNLSLGNASLVWANVHANNVLGTNLYGTIQTTSQPNITANNSTNFGGLSLATVQGQISGNAATAYSNAVANAAALYQTTAGLSANVATLTANNSTNLNGQPGSFYTNATNLTTGTLPDARLSGAVVNTSGNFTVAGNINFTAANVNFTNINVGANVDVNTTAVFVGNATVNTVTTAGQISISGATINATNYSGTANNANNLGGSSLATIQGQITGNAATAYSNAITVAANATNIASGTLDNARLPATINVTTVTATSSLLTGTSGVKRVTIDDSGITANNEVSRTTLGGGNIQITSWGTNDGSFVSRKAGGTAASPTATASGGRLGYLIGATTNDGTTFLDTASLELFADATANSTSHPTSLRFATTGSGSTTRTERVRINSTGRVGIGTTTPQQLLEVAGGASAARIRVSGANSSGIEFIDSNTGVILSNTNQIDVFTAGSVRMRVAANGNIGVGSDAANPSTSFEVRNGTAIDTYVRTVHSSATSGYDFGLTSSGDAAVFNRNNTNLLFGTNNTERMRISAGGNAAIGTSNTTSARLRVDTTGGNNYGRDSPNIFLTNTNDPGIRMLNTSNASLNHSAAMFVPGGAGGWAVTCDNNMIFDISVDITGNFLARGNVTAFSDENLKEEISTIQEALSTVSRLRGVTYKRRDTGSKGIGVIAQEVRTVIPEVVQQNGEYLSVAYGNMVGLLIEAVKELSAEVKTLRAKVDTLEERD